MFHLFNQLDTGPCCPMSINYAAVPTMRQDAALAQQWERRLTLPDYDSFAQAGMVMTEKQGGSDLRANSTVAEPAGDGWFELTGHKWFCTHPVFDVFFTLAQTEAGITCFVAERPHEGFRIQRLKDKLGGRCLASSEVEYDHLPARMLGEEGRGTAVMVEQLIWTRLDTLTGVTGMMRRVVAEAIWHARHRSAFGALLAVQPAMSNVLADLALESEAATVSTMRIARAFDSEQPEESAFRRLALAVMKYWVCKRGAPLAAEALECLGGNGYVEEAPMAQLYRDIQIGTVWEGSGNVIALDVLRALTREPGAAGAFLSECELAAGADARFDAHLAATRQGLARLASEDRPDAEWGARRLVEDMALALQASLCCVTLRPPSRTRSARLGWASEGSPSATSRVGSTVPRSSIARSRSESAPRRAGRRALDLSARPCGQARGKRASDGSRPTSSWLLRHGGAIGRAASCAGRRARRRAPEAVLVARTRNATDKLRPPSHTSVRISSTDIAVELPAAGLGKPAITRFIRPPPPSAAPRPRTSPSAGSAWPRASARGCAPTSRPRART